MTGGWMCRYSIYLYVLTSNTFALGWATSTPKCTNTKGPLALDMLNSNSRHTQATAVDCWHCSLVLINEQNIYIFFFIYQCGTLTLPCGRFYDPLARHSTSVPHSWSYWRPLRERGQHRRSSPSWDQHSAWLGLQALAATDSLRHAHPLGHPQTPETDSWLQGHKRKLGVKESWQSSDADVLFFNDDLWRCWKKCSLNLNAAQKALNNSAAKRMSLYNNEVMQKAHNAV